MEKFYRTNFRHKNRKLFLTDDKIETLQLTNFPSTIMFYIVWLYLIRIFNMYTLLFYVPFCVTFFKNNFVFLTKNRSSL